MTIPLAVQHADTPWRGIFMPTERYSDYAYPRVSVIIPTLNSATSIGDTIDSVLMQDYPDYQIIVIDSGSSDRTLEIVKNYRHHAISLYSVGPLRRYEMINIGISHADGLYVNILFPGDYYISRWTLRLVMRLALDHHKPHLVYCGTVLRDVGSDVKILYRPLTVELLKKGRQPTSLQSCWIRIDTFHEIGKFRAHYSLRGGFDFLCRFCLKGHLRAFSMRRALTDYDLRGINRRMVMRHFWETLKTIYRNFGWRTAFQWLFVQKDLGRFLKLWRASIRKAFLGS